MATYEVTIIGLDSTLKELENLKNALGSPELKKFLGKKCLDEVRKITSEKIFGFNGESIDDSKYQMSHKVELTKDSIVIYNDSMIDVSEKGWMENPYSISLAKIVEYGVGYTGSIYSNEEAPNWEYDVNNHGYKGWYYIDSDGVKKWTNGFGGKYIYLTLAKTIQEKASDWISEFIDKHYKD